MGAGAAAEDNSFHIGKHRVRLTIIFRVCISNLVELKMVWSVNKGAILCSLDLNFLGFGISKLKLNISLFPAVSKIRGKLYRNPAG